MRNSGYFSLALACASLLGNAQISFEEAYIVTLKGDTIKGEIKLNHKKEIELYSKIMFKASDNNKKSYTPARLKEYNIRGETFVSGKMDGTHVFLRRASQGRINFYEYQYEEESPSGDVLVNFDYYLQKAGEEEMVRIKENKFRKQLAELMSDNKEVVAKLEDKKTEYSEIIDIVKQYNGATEE